jgi:hypothetical protein
MKAMGKGKCMDEESPEESSLTDLITMLEDVIANKGKAKKGAMQVSISMAEPKDGTELVEGMEKEEDEEDQDELKQKYLG